jgi:hypothetical protein
LPKHCWTQQNAAFGAKVDSAKRKRETSRCFSHAQKAITTLADCCLQTWASVNAANKRCVTPLYLASQHGHAEVVKLLQEAETNRRNLATPEKLVQRRNRLLG